MKDVMLWAGAGQIGMAIARRMGAGMKIVVGDEKLATTPTEELLSLDFLQPENIRDTLHAYQMAKRCNEKRVTAQAVEWGKRGACLNDIAPGIIVTPLALDKFNGPRGDFYKNMFAKCPRGTPRHGGRSRKRRRAFDERQGRVHHGLDLPHRRRRDRKLLLRPAAPRKSMIFSLSLKKAAEPPEHSGGSAAFFTQICFSHSVLIVFTPKRK